MKILSRLLGHADVNITYSIYVHLYGDGFDEMYSALVSEPEMERLSESKSLDLPSVASAACGDGR